jgi:hypothetical protein
MLSTLTTMHALISYKTYLLTKYLITHNTSLRMLTTMYVFMVFQATLAIECLITYIKYKSAHQYEHIDAVSDCS